MISKTVSSEIFQPDFENILTSLFDKNHYCINGSTIDGIIKIVFYKSKVSVFNGYNRKSNHRCRFFELKIRKMSYRHVPQLCDKKWKASWHIDRAGEQIFVTKRRGAVQNTKGFKLSRR